MPSVKYMNLKGMLLNEINETDKHCTISLNNVEHQRQKQINKHQKTELEIQRTNRWLPEGGWLEEEKKR